MSKCNYNNMDELYTDSSSDDENVKLNTERITHELEDELAELKNKALHYSNNVTMFDENNSIKILRLYDSISHQFSIINNNFFIHSNIPELVNKLYENNKSISNQMMFRIKNVFGGSSIDNIYILKDNIFKCIIKDGCKCCSDGYFIVDIIFSNFEEKTIEVLKINEIDVYTTLHDIVYKWVLTVMKDNYIQYLIELRQVRLPDDPNSTNWKFNMNNLNILKDIVDIPYNVKICTECRYYNLDITLPCPIKQIRCCNYNYCSTIIKRKNMEQHLIECNKTKYKCNNEECKEHLYPDEMGKHEYNCIYRKTRCFDCPWRGYYKDKKNHERIKLDGSNWMPWEAELDKICKGGKSIN